MPTFPCARQRRTGGRPRTWCRIRASVYAVLWIASALAGTGCATTGPDVHGLEQIIRFDGQFDEVVFRLEPRRGRVEAVDGYGEILTVLRISSDAITAEDPEGKPLAVVMPRESTEPALLVRAPNRETVWFSLQPEPDGDFEVADGAGGLLYQAKKRDYGYKVVGGDGVLESKVRLASGKISVRNADGATFLSTRDPLPIAAATALSLDRVPFDVSAALAVAIARWWTEPE